MKSLVIAPSRRSDCKCCEIFTFPCPTSGRPEHLTWMKTKKLRHCQSTYKAVYCTILVIAICLSHSEYQYHIHARPNKDSDTNTRTDKQANRQTHAHSPAMNQAIMKQPRSPSHELPKVIRADRGRSGSLSRQPDSIIPIRFTNIETVPPTIK